MKPVNSVGIETLKKRASWCESGSDRFVGTCPPGDGKQPNELLHLIPMRQYLVRITQHSMPSHPSYHLREKTFTRHSGIETAVHRDLVKTNRWRRELGEDYAFLIRLRSTGDYGGQLHVTHEEALDAIDASKRILLVVHQENPQQFPLSKDKTD